MDFIHKIIENYESLHFRYINYLNKAGQNLGLAHRRMERPTQTSRAPVFLPNNDDDEVQQVPAVADVGAWVHHQTVGQDLQESFYGEDYEEDVLHLFLKHRTRSVRTGQRDT